MKDQIRNAYPAPSLVEEVARAICEVEALPDWRYQNCPQREEHVEQARAAIAVVLRRMEEPSEGMEDAADDPFHEELKRQRAWCEKNGRKLSLASGGFSPPMWRAMLAAFRKENGI